MLPLAFSSDKKLQNIKQAWDKIASMRESRRKGIKKAYQTLSPLVKTLHELPKYRSLEYIPTGRLVDLAYSLGKVTLTKKKLSAKIGESFYLPSILYGVAGGYIIAFRGGSRLYVAASPVTDILVERLDALKRDPVDQKAVLLYLFGAMLLPSRASLIYLTMKTVGKDPENIAKSIFMHFPNGYWGFERLALATLMEIVDTWYLGKIESVKTKKRYYLTPSHAAYVLATTFDKLVDVKDYVTLMTYVSDKHGLASLRAFSDLFSQASRNAEELLEKHPVISQVRDLVQVLRDNYSELNKEISKLSRW
ncbi:MAG: hypothetical protein QXR18_09350 [Pyrobaculum sp.]